jgi:hypothetical protein
MSFDLLKASDTLLAWHFCDDTLRDGRPIPADGVTLRHDGEIVPCESGLHASERLIDALQYAPGPLLCRVRLGGKMVPHGDDKFAAAERTILWRFDATEVLRGFGLQCALEVIDLWDAPPVFRAYLETGREDIRGAAREVITAIWDDRWNFAWDAGRAATQDNSWAAARGAANLSLAASGLASRRIDQRVIRADQNARLSRRVQVEADRLGFEMDPRQ